MYDQTTSVELSHIPHVVQKSVEFSGVGSFIDPLEGLWFVDPLDHYKHVLTAQASCSKYKISHVHDVWRDYIIACRGRWTIAESKLWCVFKRVSIPVWYFIPS